MLAVKPEVRETTVINNEKFFDWEQQKTQPISLSQLERTHREVDVYGNPLKGIHHFQLLGEVLALCKEFGYNSEVYDLFAAQNRDRTQPGVVKLPQVEQQYGENAVEAHILRRVYANIRITDFDDDETTTNLAVAFHQRGIQIGFGPNVKICHNQCMLSPELYVSSYSEKGSRGTGMEVPQMLEEVRKWLAGAKMLVEADRVKIERMKNTDVSAEQMLTIIGMLTAMRVKADTTRKSIRENITYPLNQSQITIFTEDMLEKYDTNKKITVYDMYDSATNMYKAQRMDIPAILSQNRSMVSFLNEQFQLI